MSAAPEEQPLRATIIIEWENVRLSELGRSRAMLAQLREQVDQLRQLRPGPSATPEQAFVSRFRDVEVMVLYDDEELDGAAVAKIIAETLDSSGPALPLQLLPATGRRYYQLKNFGVERAAGDVIVFLDSDVVPEDGWLHHLLASFADPEVQVVGSDVYIDPKDLYGKAFALGWFFPLRAPDETLRPAHDFFANSVAFRREIIAEHPFPTLDGASRGACASLARTLRENGVTIYQNRAAHLSHPPPNGMKHFVVRALAEGRDYVMFDGMTAATRGSLLGRMRKPLAHFRHLSTRALRSITRSRSRVDLSPAGVPVAAGIMLTYYVVHLMGEIMTVMNPRFMQEHFEI